MEPKTNQSQMNLVELLTAAGRKLRKDFQEIQDCNPHAGDRGQEVEDILKKFLSERLRNALASNLESLSVKTELSADSVT